MPDNQEDAPESRRRPYRVDSFVRGGWRLGTGRYATAEKAVETALQWLDAGACTKAEVYDIHSHHVVWVLPEAFSPQPHRRANEC